VAGPEQECKRRRGKEEEPKRSELERGGEQGSRRRGKEEKEEESQGMMINITLKFHALNNAYLLWLQERSSSEENASDHEREKKKKKKRKKEKKSRKSSSSDSDSEVESNKVFKTIF
jgi:hypothetical protein